MSEPTRLRIVPTTAPSILPGAITYIGTEQYPPISHVDPDPIEETLRIWFRWGIHAATAACWFAAGFVMALVMNR